MVEYYTGQDASKLTTGSLAMKIAHIERLRKLESQNKLSETISGLINGKQ